MGVSNTPKLGLPAGGRGAADPAEDCGVRGALLPHYACAGSPGSACTAGPSPRDGAARPALAISGTSGLAACPACGGAPPARPACSGLPSTLSCLRWGDGAAHHSPR